MSNLHTFNELLRTAHERGASDLHITAGAPPVLRVHGSLLPLEGSPLSTEDTSGMVLAVMTPDQAERFGRTGEVDFSYEVEGLSRYRVNAYRQRGKVSLAARTIPAKIPTLEELRLPPAVQSLTQRPHGLVLVTGPTGSGKSSTLAALINHINKTQRKHIVTLEDPIEFLHAHGSSVINQREVGSDTRSFADGLRAVLRQDPDVILVGEMRDLETITAAVTAAETGHLVFATLHTTDAPQTIDRIVDAFPAHQQGQIRIQLAAVLVGVVSQRLLPKPRGEGRTCVTEIMMNTPAVANLIRTEKVHQIKSVMQTGRLQGMHTMDMAIKELLQQGLVDPLAAKAYLQEGGA
ncbi:type IV pilus twitching motility protein PilT [Paenibacillus mucilaginosus]|uniref:Twitching motility protein n=1 Tax=Paenibacillus mucilaginosus (strain KNP414) TaxID=1036673 RepID=F8FN54_PAEMK|nr:type IV pilus twitching motility protein PilT [Paenibacillus mucilaginosus]AEI45724.1 twitching motility protein [Paenibacillus mucilaginosus KNP414]MCG7215089.1 type IV pilus twitching motility protein PilT [Paenibacillus mucilaginosus]WDM27111.1 type IV pilus twitching motility protein PilT [Paenibacillus mucilaginosus]